MLRCGGCCVEVRSCYTCTVFILHVFAGDSDDEESVQSEVRQS